MDTVTLIKYGNHKKWVWIHYEVVVNPKSGRNKWQFATVGLGRGFDSYYEAFTNAERYVKQIGEVYSIDENQDWYRGLPDVGTALSAERVKAL